MTLDLGDRDRPARQGGPGATLISAHRGGAGLWPENSLTAFRGACELAVDSVELDVHPSAEGKIVVHHDAVLGRVVEGEGPLCTLPWEALARLRFKDSPQEHMPLLEAVLAVLRPSPLRLRLEFKVGPDKRPYPGIVEAVHGQLARAGMLRRTIVSSFEPAYLETVAATDPTLHRLWLIRNGLLDEIGVDGVIAEAVALGVPEVDLRAERIRPEWPERFAAAGLQLGAYAANQREVIARMFELGVVMFTTDRPDLAVELRPMH